MRWRKLIKDNQKNFSRLHMLIDVFVIAASCALAWLIRFQGIFEHSAGPVQDRPGIYVYADIHYSGIFTSLSGL